MPLEDPTPLSKSNSSSLKEFESASSVSVRHVNRTHVNVCEKKCN